MNAVDPAISPDGRRIAFTALLPNGEQRIGVASLADPADVTLLTRSADGAVGASQAGVVSRRRDRSATRRGRISGSYPLRAGRRAVSRAEADDAMNPAWSSDGKHVYFSSEREGTLALWRISVEGGPGREAHDRAAATSTTRPSPRTVHGSPIRRRPSRARCSSGIWGRDGTRSCREYATSALPPSRPTGARSCTLPIAGGRPSISGCSLSTTGFRRASPSA